MCKKRTDDVTEMNLRYDEGEVVIWTWRERLGRFVFFLNSLNRKNDGLKFLV